MDKKLISAQMTVHVQYTDIVYQYTEMLVHEASYFSLFGCFYLVPHGLFYYALALRDQF